MLSKLDLLIDRWFGRSCFMPWAFALVCFATLNILISGIGRPGALPNHKNGPSLMVFGSNRTQITQALGLFTNLTLALTWPVAAVSKEDFNHSILNALRPG